MANGKVRTDEELKRLEYNYFEAFNIKLEETNGDVIAKKINPLCNTYANSSDPVKVRLGKELKTDVLEIMQYDAVYDPNSGTYRRNAGGRQKEAEACKRMHAEKVVAFIRSLGNRGIIYMSEIEQVIKKHGLDMKDIDGQLQQLKRGGLSIVDDTKNIYDFKSYDEIDKLLLSHEEGKYKDLFELIGINRDGTAAEAKVKFDEEDKATFSKRQQKQFLALKNLFGKAKVIFDGKDEKFKAYRKYVFFRDNVFAPLKSLSENGISTIGKDEYLNYIGLLCKIPGESQDDATEDLAYILKYLHIKLSDEAVIKNIKIEICPYTDCGKAYIPDPSTAVCPHCGKPLEKECWNCKNKIRIKPGVLICSRCGATEKSQADFNAQAVAFDSLLAGGATAAQMRQSLSKLKGIVPGYTKAPGSEVALKIAKCDQAIKDRENGEQELLLKFNKAITEIDKQMMLKNYFKAQSLLADLRKSIPGFNAAQMDNYAKRIAAEIAKSDAFLKQAKTALAGGNSAMAISNAAKAIEACADNAEAKQLMRKVPPAAPTAIRCKIISDKIISIEWDCSPQQLTTYSIIRKIGTVPKAANDGMVIAKGLTSTIYEDKNITTGTPYYYGVFAERAEVTSTVTAVNKSVAVFPDITDCMQEMVEDAIKVKWTCPDNASSVTVRKVKGVAAVSATSGKVIATDGNNGFTDSDCDKTGCSYFVICNYDVGGSKISSKGVQLYYKPYLIPKAVQDLNIQRGNNGQFTLSGTNLTAETRLYLFPNKPVIPVNSAERKDKLNVAVSSARQLSMSASGSSFVVSLGSGGAGWLCAINSNDQLYIACKPVYVTTVSGLSNIKYSTDSNKITVEFSKIPAVKSIVAKVSKTAFPETIEDGGDKYEFNSSQISGGKITFALPGDSMAYVTLFAYAGDGADKTLCAPVSLSGVIDNRKKQTVNYDIEYTISNSKAFNVTVKFEADNPVDLTDLVFVAGNPWPMNKNAGTEIYRCSSPVLKKGIFSSKFTAKITFKAQPMSPYNKIAMFIVDDNIKTIILKRVNL